MDSVPRLRRRLEIIVILAIAGAVLVASKFNAFGLIPEIQQWLVPVVFLYAPLIASLITDRDFTGIGLGAPVWKKAAIDLTAFCLLILPVFLASWWAIFHYGFNRSFAPGLPDKFLSLCIWQLLGIALPEEVFFRGWLQGRLNSILPRTWSVPGATIGPGLFISAVIFALAHYLVSPEPMRLLVFFPAMLFGYYRERSESVVAPALAHAVGNVTFLTLQLSLV